MSDEKKGVQMRPEMMAMGCVQLCAVGVDMRSTFATFDSKSPPLPARSMVKRLKQARNKYAPRPRSPLNSPLSCPQLARRRKILIHPASTRPLLPHPDPGIRPSAKCQRTVQKSDRQGHKPEHMHKQNGRNTLRQSSEHPGDRLETVTETSHN